MKHILILLVLLLIIPGPSVLQGGQEGTNPGTPVHVTRLRSYPVPWPFTNNSGLDEPLRVLIRDGEAWCEMWKRIHSRGSPLPPLPEIDFSREMVVVVALGARPTGGYGIIIDGAYERDGRLEIALRSVSPGKGCTNTAAVTPPVDIVRLPKTERSVVFRETEVVHECK